MTALIDLPTTFTIRPPKRVFDIKPSEKMFYVDGINGLFFNVPSGAYNYVKDVLGGEPRFNPDDLLQAGHFVDNIFFENLGNHYDDVRSFPMFHENTEYRDKLQSVYNKFLKLNDEYQNNQDSWGHAYEWLKNHPAFCHQKDTKTDYWVTDDGLVNQKINVINSGNREGQYATVIVMTQSVWVDGVNHAGVRYARFTPEVDKRLTVRNHTSLEKSYVLLAKKVNKFYTVTGDTITV